MKEVEVKVGVKNLEKVEQQLVRQGFNFSKTVEQQDIIFAMPDVIAKYDTFIPNLNLFRIRWAGKKIFFTLKVSQTGELDNIEREVEISKAEPVIDMLGYLGFKESARVRKVRKVARYDHYEISLDNVEGLGTYLEVERMVDMHTDSIQIQKEIWKFLEGLGFSREDEETRGYDILIYLKNKKSE